MRYALRCRGLRHKIFQALLSLLNYRAERGSKDGMICYRLSTQGHHSFHWRDFHPVAVEANKRVSP
jgi:hypothetical protein